MKTLLIISLLIITTSLCAENEILLTSRPKKVTVFQTSAQVTKTATFNAESGVSSLVFESVSPFIDTRNIQASGKGEFIILDVQYRLKEPIPAEPVNDVIPEKIAKSIQLLEDSLVQLNFDIDDLVSKKDILLLEKKTLLGNKFMQGNADTIPDLKMAMDYLRKQLNDINNSLNALKRQEFQLTSKKTKMEARLAELQNYNAWKNPEEPELPKHQVVVTIQSKAAVSGSITINYMVQNAGWTPSYDIRATSSSQPVKLVQKASVYQNTGEDWNDVKLTLSTITPSAGINKPVLPVYYISYYYLSPARAVSDEMMKTAAGTAMSRPVSEAETDAYTSAMYTTTNQTLTNAEFEIDLAYTIPDDGKPHMIAVKEHNLKAEFVHYVMPEMSKYAWLVAKITDWNNLDLLSASASIYFDGTFVGETSLSTGMFSDTLELALGTDRSLVVERKRNKDEQRNALIGTNVIKTVSYTLNIRNNKYNDVNLIVEDRMPVSGDTEIKVEKVNLSGADLNEETGILTWKAKVASGQSKNITFSYSVEYDKNKPLAAM